MDNRQSDLSDAGDSAVGGLSNLFVLLQGCQKASLSLTFRQLIYGLFEI
jgi:hypothetical protein